MFWYLEKKIMVFKLELSTQNFNNDVLNPLYSALIKSIRSHTHFFTLVLNLDWHYHDSSCLFMQRSANLCKNVQKNMNALFSSSIHQYPEFHILNNWPLYSNQASLYSSFPFSKEYECSFLIQFFQFSFHTKEAFRI